MTTFKGHLLTGDHASRPAANTVPDGTLYSCTDHGIVYQADEPGNAWNDWAEFVPAGSTLSQMLLDGRAPRMHRHIANEANLPGITALIAASAGGAVDSDQNILANQIFGA